MDYPLSTPIQPPPVMVHTGLFIAVLVTFLFPLLAEAAQNGSLCESSFLSFPFQQAAVQQGSHLLGLDGLDDIDVFSSHEGLSPSMGCFSSQRPHKTVHSVSLLSFLSNRPPSNTNHTCWVLMVLMAAMTLMSLPCMRAFPL
jgi:hypothetical protein